MYWKILLNKQSLIFVLPVLDLSHNSLSNLPEELSHLSQLNQLNLSHNQFTEVPVVLYNITSVENINLSQNQIKGLCCVCYISTINITRNDWDKFDFAFGSSNISKETVNHDFLWMSFFFSVLSIFFKLWSFIFMESEFSPLQLTKSLMGESLAFPVNMNWVEKRTNWENWLPLNMLNLEKLTTVKKMVQQC